jgi:hypothetical protein
MKKTSTDIASIAGIVSKRRRAIYASNIGSAFREGEIIREAGAPASRIGNAIYSAM